MRHEDYIQRGSPVVVRSYTSGVIVGRLVGGEDRTVVAQPWRWLRRWEGVGGEGSVTDLIKSDVRPQRRGPLMEEVGVFSPADCYAIDEAAYERLAGG